MKRASENGDEKAGKSKEEDDRLEAVDSTTVCLHAISTVRLLHQKIEGSARARRGVKVRERE